MPDFREKAGVVTAHIREADTFVCRYARGALARNKMLFAPVHSDLGKRSGLMARVLDKFRREARSALLLVMPEDPRTHEGAFELVKEVLVYAGLDSVLEQALDRYERKVQVSMLNDDELIHSVINGVRGYVRDRIDRQLPSLAEQHDMIFRLGRGREVVATAMSPLYTPDFARYFPHLVLALIDAREVFGAQQAGGDVLDGTRRAFMNPCNAVATTFEGSPLTYDSNTVYAMQGEVGGRQLSRRFQDHRARGIAVDRGDRVVELDPSDAHIVDL
ncbi:MAG: hypothetical protein Q8P95_01240 [bacterium]|nr:hypothetical protein [bacterium]